MYSEENVKYIIYESSIKYFKTKYRQISRLCMRNKDAYTDHVIHHYIYELHQEVLFLVSGKYNFDVDAGKHMINLLKKWCIDYDKKHSYKLYERLVENHVFEF